MHISQHAQDTIMESLRTMANGRGAVSEQQGTIAQHAGYSPRQTRAILRQLHTAGRITRHTHRGRGQKCTYELH